MSIFLSRRVYLCLLLSIGLGTLSLCLGVQYFAHIPPCFLCHFERIPYGVLVIVSLGGLIFSRVSLKNLNRILWVTFLGSCLLAAYHVGVEISIFPTPTTCATPFSLVDLHSVEQIQKALPLEPTFSCADTTASFLGLSLTVYNFLLSLGLWLAISLVFAYNSLIKDYS